MSRCGEDNLCPLTKTGKKLYETQPMNIYFKQNTYKLALTTIALVVCSFFSTLPLVAELAVEFDISPKVLQIGEAAQCIIKVRGQDNPSIPRLPPIDGLQFSGPGRSVSKSLNIVNGKRQMDSSVTFTYRIMPMRPGVFSIGPYTYASKGETAQLPKTELRVVDRNGQTASNPENSGTPPVFAELSTSATNVFHQQLFDLTISIYSRGLQMANDINLINMPESGLDIRQFRELRPDRVIIDQVVYDVRRYQAKVQALTAGKFNLSPTLQAGVLIESQRSRRRSFFDSPFDSFFGGPEVQRINLQPDPLQIYVQPLPQDNQPASFNSAVGSFSFDVQTTPTDVTVGDPITLKITISGQGNIETLTAPDYNPGSGFKIYDAKLVNKQSDANRGIGTKEFEQVILPRDPSITEIPPVMFTYFNPANGQYETLKKGPFAVRIHENTNTVSYVVQAQREATEKARILGEDIVYLKDAPDQWDTTQATSPFSKASFWIIQSIPLFMIGLLAAFVYRRDQLRTDRAKARRAEAPRSARRALKNAQSVLGTDSAAFYEALWSALAEYFANRLNLAAGEISIDVLEKSFSQTPDGNELLSRIQPMIERCEQARFGLQADATTEEKQKQLDDLQELLKDCERVRIST